MVIFLTGPAWRLVSSALVGGWAVGSPESVTTSSACSQSAFFDVTLLPPPFLRAVLPPPFRSLAVGTFWLLFRPSPPPTRMVRPVASLKTRRYVPGCFAPTLPPSCAVPQR